MGMYSYFIKADQNARIFIESDGGYILKMFKRSNLGSARMNSLKQDTLYHLCILTVIKHKLPTNDLPEDIQEEMQKYYLSLTDIGQSMDGWKFYGYMDEWLIGWMNQLYNQVEFLENKPASIYFYYEGDIVVRWKMLPQKRLYVIEEFDVKRIEVGQEEIDEDENLAVMYARRTKVYNLSLTELSQLDYFVFRPILPGKD